MSVDTTNNDVLTPEKATIEMRPPSKFICVLINDDFTPMDFVVYILMSIFNKNEEDATALMLDVHKKGKAVVTSPISRDIAETKRTQTMEAAQEFGHPLQCEVKEV
jgi:ATP-dependent Clp protease adaptor protein ClpS